MHTDNIEAPFGLCFHPLAIDKSVITPYVLIVQLAGGISYMSSAIGWSAWNRTSKGSSDAMTISDFLALSAQLLQQQLLFFLVKIRNQGTILAISKRKKESKEKERYWIMMRIFPYDIDGHSWGVILPRITKGGVGRASQGQAQELSRNTSFPSMHTPLACVAGHVSHPSDGILLDRPHQEKKRWESKVPWRAASISIIKTQRCMRAVLPPGCLVLMDVCMWLW
jgi:hypothetical protein